MQIAPIISQHLSPLKNVLHTTELPDAELQAAEALRQLNLGNMTAANLLEQLEAKQLESNPQGALPILNEILRANPKNLRALSLMGSVLTLLGRDTEALTYLQQALSLDDRDALSNQKLGMIMVRKHQLEAAIPYLQKALTSRPDEAETLNTLAVALINLRRVSEAVEYFRRAASVEPDNAVAKRNLQNAEKLLRQSTAFR
jgi:Flp pilus assembly protein TadD